MLALLGLRHEAAEHFRPPGQGSEKHGFFHHFPEPLPLARV
jgi:hypothetical protein